MKNNIAQKLHHSGDMGVSFGCLNCPERELCGGLRVSGDHYDCMVFCVCEDPSSCELACPNNLPVYIARHQEVRGFSFDNVPRTQVLSVGDLPPSVPVIYHASKRVGALRTEAVAIPLSYLFNRKTGALRFASREEIAENFGFEETARLVILGVDQDDRIEDYWALRLAARTPDRLAALRPDLITVPNFSLPLDVIRYDNLHNLKRIALCWSELMLAGIPTALHVNARTDRDWERWIEFIAERKEVKVVSFEFATGPARPEWGKWYASKLVELGIAVPRHMQLITRGGYAYLPILRSAFSNVVFIDSTSFMKTIKRKKLVLEPGKQPRWIDARTRPREHLDALLQENVEASMKLIVRGNPAIAADVSIDSILGEQVSGHGLINLVPLRP
jgi:Domain of unknown function (DUF4417)